jgi:hypothetical protein
MELTLTVTDLVIDDPEEGAEMCSRRINLNSLVLTSFGAPIIGFSDDLNAVKSLHRPSKRTLSLGTQ